MLRRNFLLLPLVAIGTMLLLILSAEWAFRSAYPAVLADSCIATPPSHPVPHGRPNCTSYLKASEGPWAAIHYNGCGYRTPEPCGPKPTGTLRVAVVGSSTGAGYAVPYGDTMSARTARALQKICHKPVEFQNLGVPGEQAGKLVGRVQEALRLEPDALLIVISPFDFELTADLKTDNLDDRTAKTSPMRRLKASIASSRLLYMSSYFVLRADGSYLPIYLRSGTNPDFMRTPMPARWLAALHAFDVAMIQVANLAHDHAVPVTLLFVPQRAEAVLASSATPNPGFDPAHLPAILRGIAVRNGVTFANMLYDIPARTPSASIFYAVNGHINGQGHAIASRTLLRQMTAPGPFMDKCMSALHSPPNATRQQR
jgi:hypothetical protein